MKLRWKPLIVSLLLALLAGGLGALLGGGMDSYEALSRPPLSPPGWLFPVVWTLLYLMMGAAAYRIYVLRYPVAERRGALRLYAVQLLANAMWPGCSSGWAYTGAQPPGWPCCWHLCSGPGRASSAWTTWPVY